MSVERRQAVAGQLRSLADRLVTDDLDELQLAQIEAHLDRAAAVPPADAPGRTRFARGLATIARHPIAEGTSGVYPRLELDIEDRRLHADIEFGPAWEGPPDLVHGGYLAAGFDMVLSAMASRVLGHAVTRHLRVRYLRPTFRTAHLHYEVEADEPVGRLLELRGRLLADGRVTMRASGQFASLDESRFADQRRTAVGGQPAGAVG